MLTGISEFVAANFLIIECSILALIFLFIFVNSINIRKVLNLSNKLKEVITENIYLSQKVKELEKQIKESESSTSKKKFNNHSCSENTNSTIDYNKIVEALNAKVEEIKDAIIDKLDEYEPENCEEIGETVDSILDYVKELSESVQELALESSIDELKESLNDIEEATSCLSEIDGDELSDAIEYINDMQSEED